MAKLCEAFSAAADYLSAIDPSLQAEAYIPVTRWGYNINNITETVNRVLKDNQGLDLFGLLTAIWSRVSTMRFDRVWTAIDLIKRINSSHPIAKTS